METLRHRRGRRSGRRGRGRRRTEPVVEGGVKARWFWVSGDVATPRWVIQLPFIPPARSSCTKLSLSNSPSLPPALPPPRRGTASRQATPAARVGTPRQRRRFDAGAGRASASTPGLGLGEGGRGRGGEGGAVWCVDGARARCAGWRARRQLGEPEAWVCGSLPRKDTSEWGGREGAGSAAMKKEERVSRRLCVEQREDNSPRVSVCRERLTARVLRQFGWPGVRPFLQIPLARAHRDGGPHQKGAPHRRQTG